MRKTDSVLKFARAVCILGAVFDGLTLVPMLFPSIGGMIFGIQGFAPGADYRYAMNIGASLMLGWTLLLVWAARRPVLRAAVLPLTVVVVLGLLAAGIGAVTSGLIPLKNMMPTFVLQAVVIILFSIAYAQLRRIDVGPQL